MLIRRIVIEVGVVEVNEKKKRFFAILPQPGIRCIHHLGGRDLLLGVVLQRLLKIVELIETALEAVALRNEPGGHKAAGRIPGLLKDFGCHSGLVGDALAALDAAVG